MSRALLCCVRPPARLAAFVACASALAMLAGCQNGHVDAEAVGYVVAVPLIAYMYAAPFIFGWGRGGCH